MLDKLLKMDSALLTIKVQIAKYTALFAADGTIDASEQAFLNALEEDAKRIDEKLGKVIVKAKAVSNEKSATTEKTEALAVGEVVVTVKAAGGMEVLEAVPAMSGDETGAGMEIEAIAQEDGAPNDNTKCITELEKTIALCNTSPYSTIFGNINNLKSSDDNTPIETINIDQNTQIYVAVRTAYEKFKHCYDNYNNKQQIQSNYIFNRLLLLNKSLGVKGEVLRILYGLQTEYTLLPETIKVNVAEVETQLMLISVEELSQIKSILKKNIVGNLKGQINNTTVEAIIGGMPQYTHQFQREIDMFNELYRLSTRIDTYINNPKGICAEDIARRILRLNMILIQLSMLETNLSISERMDDYDAANDQASALIVEWNEFANQFQQGEMGAINIETFKGTRCESVLLKVIEAYKNSGNTILELQRRIDNFPMLAVVRDYQIAHTSYYRLVEPRIAVGCPTDQDTQSLNNLIRLLEQVQTAFNQNPSLQAQTSLRDINLAEYLAIFREKLAECQHQFQLRESWRARLQNGILEPNPLSIESNNLPDGHEGRIKKYKRKKKTPIGNADENDGDNLTAPDDISQGALGDCYFLAAVASIAEEPNFFYNPNDPNSGAIRVVLNPDNTKKVLHFLVRMYLPIKQPSADNPTPERTEVLVKVLPKFLKNGDDFYYAKKGDNQELWVAIMEKAFAEVKTGYRFTEGGFTEEAFGLLLNRNPDQIQRIDLRRPAALNTLRNGSKSDAELILRLLTTSLQERRKITASSKMESELRAVTPAPFNAEAADPEDHSIRVTEEIRVVPSHAYSIQAVKNTNIILRNPHGDFGVAGALLEINCTQLWQFFSGLVIV